MSDDQLFSEKTISEKQYVLGRKEKTTKGVLNIGRYYALDGSLGANVYIDVLRPHVILICGKRGYGKSYTIGVFLEELERLDTEVKENLGIVVFDTLGIFWSSRYKNREELEQLKKWNIQPSAIDIRLLVPIKFLEHYEKQNIEATGFSIPVVDLSPYHWCQLFNIKPTDPLGIVVTRAILQLQNRQTPFSIPDIIQFIQRDDKSEASMKIAAENFFTMADGWGIFAKQGTPISEIVQRGMLSIIDFSHLPNQQLKSITAALIGEQIFEARVRERKIHEQKKIGFDVEEKGMPMVLLAIDEAQLFIPSDENLLSKEIFINEWMRQGRQPGLSLIMATQRPSALAPEVLSHSDIILCHRLTAQEDIDALSRIRPTYMAGDIKESIKKIGDEKGVALIIDDTSESSHILKIRPRISWHGGSESRVVESNLKKDPVEKL
ncbi:MAG: ATP-binding protein [Candidatus Thermoplasmatota archaeon]